MLIWYSWMTKMLIKAPMQSSHLLEPCFHWSICSPSCLDIACFPGDRALLAAPFPCWQYLIEAGFPLQGIKSLQVMHKESPLQVGQGLHPHLSPCITTQAGNTWMGHKLKWRGGSAFLTKEFQSFLISINGLLLYAHFSTVMELLIKCCKAKMSLKIGEIYCLTFLKYNQGRIKLAIPLVSL